MTNVPETTEQESPPLKLAGTDAEDIAILSAILQDAVVLASEIRHDAAARQFSLTAQRYRWEDKSDTTRSNCRVMVSGVAGLAASQLHRKPADTPQLPDSAFSLLALSLPTPETLEVTFAGETRLRLTLQPGWQLLIEDFGPPWPCPCPQQHKGD